MKLGIFDSGIGGEAVAVALQKTFPTADMLVVNDKENVPYGDKTADQVIALTNTAIQPLLLAHCDIIILACNTATALAIETLRNTYPDQKFIGIEPMIKSAAANTRSGIVVVCATPATLKSHRYHNLVNRYGHSLTILEPDCRNWAYWIENNQLNRAHIAYVVETACQQGADVIVLGCTHYHWIKELIVELAAGRAVVIEPSDAIGRRVVQLLDQK
jgi:glutamate racemase